MLPLRKGLNDPSPYVRKTAVTGVAKLYRLYPQQIKGAFVSFVLTFDLFIALVEITTRAHH